MEHNWSTHVATKDDATSRSETSDGASEASADGEKPNQTGAAAASASTACYNCGAQLHGPFCAACGQQAAPLNPRLRDVARDVVHEVLDVDGRTMRTLRRLFLSPGFLTRELCEGRRVSWLPPIRLYLIFSVLYFATASFTLDSMFDVRMTKTGEDAGAGPSGRAPASAEQGATASANQGVARSQDEEEAEAFRRLGYRNEAELQQAAAQAQATWMPRVMFLLVPLFAWLVQVARRRDGRTYPQHLFFALHVHAVWFAAGTLAVIVRVVDEGVVGGVVRGLIGVYALTYLVLAFRAAYGGTVRRALLHSVMVIPAYWVAVIVVTVAIMIPTVFSRLIFTMLSGR